MNELHGDPLAGLLPEEAMRVMLENLVHEAVLDLDRDHVLIITYEQGAMVTGPYAGALAALCALEDQRRTDQELSVSHANYHLAPVLPPFCSPA